MSLIPNRWREDYDPQPRERPDRDEYADLDRPREVSRESVDVVADAYRIARAHHITTRDELATRRAAKQERAARDATRPHGNVTFLGARHASNNNTTDPDTTGSAA